MTFQIRSFHPSSATRGEWALYHQFRRLRHEERDPDDPLLGDRATEKLMKRQDPEWEELYFAAMEGVERPEELSGWLELGMTRNGSLAHETNGHMAWAELEVLAPERRLGIGKLMLARVAEIAKERGRSLLIGGSDEATGIAFIEAIGAQVAQRWRESRLYLDKVDWRMMEGWVRDGKKRSPNSSLRFLTDYPEASIVMDYCELLQDVSNQEPRGDLDIGDEFLTPEILKERVDNFLESGGTILRAVTQEENGDLSGLTTMGYLPGEETHIHQWMTGVKDIYRGRGLGKWLKAAMLLRVRERYPQVKIVRTGNATTNEAMLSINERMGYRLYKQGVEAQIPLKALESYLRT